MEQSTPSASSSLYDTYTDDPTYPLRLSRLFSMFYSSGSQSVVFGSATSASNENMLEMWTHWPHPRPTESETLGVRPRKTHFKEPQVLLMHLKFEILFSTSFPPTCLQPKHLPDQYLELFIQNLELRHSTL